MKYAIIMGATSGIGEALAVLLAKKHHHLLLIGQNYEKLLSLKEELKNDVDIKILVVDLTKDYHQVINYVEEQTLEIELLCNNAGIGDYGSFLDGDLEKYQKIMQLNMESVVGLCYDFGHYFMKQKEGTIINISSTGAFVPGPYMALYYASKAFITSFSEALYYELKPTVDVLWVAPGPTKSNFLVTSSRNGENLTKHIKQDDPSKVAKTIYQTWKKKKMGAVVGLKNKLAIFSLRFISRKTAGKIVKKIQIKRK